MITVRCRLLQTLEFFIILSVFWTIALFLFWHVRGPCEQRGVESSQNFRNGGRFDAPGHVTPVYIVEEHHEVLLYWFGAAEKGYIPRQGNVLVHIDGHPDAAPPTHKHLLPVFTWPSMQDIYNMMQRNDVFIASAAVTGLISRYIWIRPPWDESVHHPTDHALIYINIGTTRVGDSGDLKQDFCVCMRAHPPDLFPWTGEQCGVTEESDSGETIRKIPADECKVRVHNVLVEMLFEDKAIQLLESGEWISPLDSVILDVDEDYYGVEAAVLPLYQVNLTEHKLMFLEHFVMRIFCGDRPPQERAADNLFSYLLRTVASVRQFCSGAKGSHCKDKSYMRELILENIRDVVKDQFSRDLSPFCESRSVTFHHVGDLISLLQGYNKEQLRALEKVGVCLKSSPRTLFYDKQEGMRLCDGYNRPNKSAVIFHTPSSSEIDFRTSQLKDMLSSKGIHPGIVTICRSVRDGYTPRGLFSQIEADILHVLQQVFPSIDVTSIVYDPFLLGGRHGWWNRH